MGFHCTSCQLTNILLLFNMCRQGQFRAADVFQDVMPLCERVHSMVDKVFGNNAEVVMGKMVQNIHEDVLKVCNILQI